MHQCSFPGFEHHGLSEVGHHEFVRRDALPAQRLVQQAGRLIDVVNAYPREQALELGPEKAYALLRYAAATPADDVATALAASNARIGRKSVRTLTVRELTGLTRRLTARRRTVDPELRSARRQATAAQRKIRAQGARGVVMSARRAAGQTWIRIEVPAAAVMANHFAKEVNFFSIGTNDLVQYTLAVDRTNERVAGLFCPAHPAVLSFVRDVIRAGTRAGIGVSVCGEMAGDPLYTLLLLGLGLNTFSMNGPDIPEVKKIIRSTTMEHARQVARKVMSFDSERQVMHFLREETRKIIPEAF